MNDFDEELAASVTASATFGAADVGARVAGRHRRRRVGSIALVGLLVAAGVGSAFVFAGDDEPDLEAVDVPPTSISSPADDSAELLPVVEDPLGADGVAGAMSDLHVETTDTFGFTACGADGEPGPPAGDRAVELEALIDELRAGGLHDQPFAVSSGGPQSIWGVPSVGLSSRYEPTLRWIADRVDPTDVCVEFPEFGVRNLPPELATVTFEVDSDAGEVTVTAEGCAPKGEWVHPFIQNRNGGAEVGIAIGRGGLAFTDDCPSPTPHVFELLNKAAVTIAGEPGTLIFDGVVERGGSIDLSFDLVNAASATTGDDLIAQHSDDPTVQFQVSDIFGDGPVAGAVGDVATDQWPITGTGTIVVPPGVPAGTYFVRLIDAPELNGTLEVAVSAGEETESSMGPDWGWYVPDLDGDGDLDVIDGQNGQVFLRFLDGVTPLRDSDGDLVSVPIDGDEVFTCNAPDDTLLVQRDDPVGEDLARRLSELEVVDGVASWLPSPSFFHTDWLLPERGQGCETFGTPPGPRPLADGPISDVHVEAIEMVFPDCASPLDPQETTSERRASLQELSDLLMADGLTDPSFFLAMSGISGDRLQIGLYRRYGPTVEFVAERAAADDVCWFILPPVGAFTAVPDALDWVVDDTTIEGPDDTSFSVVNAGSCGVIYKELLLPPQVAEFDDRIEIGVPLLSRHGPSRLPCPIPDVFEIELSEPIANRTVVAAPGPTVRISPDRAVPPFDTAFTLEFDSAGLGDEATMGDDVMLQSVADPSIQIQIGGVFTDSPTAGEPGPIVTDRWAATGTAQLIVPAGTPSGEYTFMFIEHPQFWGTITLA